MSSVFSSDRIVPAAAFLDGSASQVHRAMNERRCADARAAGQRTVKCECECSRVECFSGFTVEIGEYQAIRASPDRFIVAPGHETPDEAVVSQAADYLVVDKRLQTEDSARVA